LLQSIKDYVDMRDKVQPDFDRLTKEAPTDLQVVLDELAAREAKLDEVWKQAILEMNPLERRRYAGMIGKDPTGAPEPQLAAVPITPYPQSVLDVLERVRKVFPSAKIVVFAKPGEKLVLPAPKPGSMYDPVSRLTRPEGTPAPVQGIKRFEPAPAAELAKPAEPEQPRLL